MGRSGPPLPQHCWEDAGAGPTEGRGRVWGCPAVTGPPPPPRTAGKLRKVLHCCPEVLTAHHRDLDGVVRLLREKCLFTAQQVTEILHRCPHVLRADPGELEYKFQVRWAGRGWGWPWALGCSGAALRVRVRWHRSVAFLSLMVGGPAEVSESRCLCLKQIM